MIDQSLKFRNANEPLIHTSGIIALSTHTALKKSHINISRLIARLTYDYVKEEGLR